MTEPVQSALLTPEAMTRKLGALLPEFASVQWLSSTGSTNADLIQQAKQAAGCASWPSLLGAATQTAGRGRAGRPWQNAPDTTLMFSCAFQIGLPLAQLPGLSPVLGIAACVALRALIEAQRAATNDAMQHTRLQLKWPNDLVWDQAKLAGILVESTQTPGSRGQDRVPLIVAGIGLNLSGAQRLSAALGRPIADWSQISAASPSAIVACIARAWSDAIKEYAAGGYAAFMQRFHDVDALAGQTVDVTDQGTVLQTGQVIGTDTTGRLLVQTGSDISAIMVGDISIRPTRSAGLT